MFGLDVGTLPVLDVHGQHPLYGCGATSSDDVNCLQAQAQVWL